MSPDDNNGGDFRSDDMLAAEYVVGVLSADDRATVSARIENDASFARLVNGWVQRLSPLDSAYPEVTPPASVKAALDRRLFASTADEQVPSRAAGGLWSSLTFWRGLAMGALAALALYIAIPLVNPPGPPAPDPRFVANMVADGSEVHFLAVYDRGAGVVGLTHVAGPRPDGRDFELWMIEGQNAPVSMGVIPQGQTARISVSGAARAKLAAGAVLAVSLEPAGGSTTGQPTGPVVAAGDLRDI